MILHAYRDSRYQILKAIIIREEVTVLVVSTFVKIGRTLNT